MLATGQISLAEVETKRRFVGHVVYNALEQGHRLFRGAHAQVTFAQLMVGYDKGGVLFYGEFEALGRAFQVAFHAGRDAVVVVAFRIVAAECHYG